MRQNMLRCLAFVFGHIHFDEPKKVPGTFFLICLLSSAAFADVQRFVVNNRDHAVKFEILNDKLVHFEFARNEIVDAASSIPTTPMVAKKDFAGPQSYSTLENGFETSALKVSYDRATLCVSIVDKIAGKPLTSLCPKETKAGTFEFSIDKGSMENVYGLGEQFRVLGQVNGDWVGDVRAPATPYGNSLVGFGGGAVGNAQFPVMYALGAGTLNYALFVDHTPAQTWDFKSSPWTMTTTGKRLRWYFLAGGNLSELRSAYMDLVGHPLVPPKKALGLWVSEFGYRDWHEMEDKLRTLRKNHFPIDGFVLDVYWFGPFYQDSEANSFGKFAFDEAHFPEPAQEMSKLKNREGIGIATIEDSYINYNLPEYALMSSKGYLVKSKLTGQTLELSSWWGRGGMVDWSNPEAAAFWHDTKRQVAVNQGVMIHWTDLAEPETHSGDSKYAGATGLDSDGEDEMHNIYALKWSQSIAEGYARNHMTRRQFILSRSGTSGIQRYGDALWSGDIGSNMRSLSAHLNAQTHMSFSGVDYFGCDIGGFHREALEGTVDEMYTRWFAHSTLYDLPVRPHTDNGSKKNNTPPDRVGDVKSNLFNIRQRYELSPYYYSLAYRAHLFGEPVVPPALFYFQADENLRQRADEKMIGPFLLSATAAKDGEVTRSVYLPSGLWRDYHTGQWFASRGEKFDGIAEYQAGIFRVPLFIREGAIVPRMLVDDKTMNVLGKRTDASIDTTLRLTVVPSSSGSQFTLYEDDGESIAYLSGQSAATLITQKREGNRVTVSVEPTQGKFDGMPLTKPVRIDLFVKDAQVATVAINGSALQRKNAPSDLTSSKPGWAEDVADHAVIQTEPISLGANKTIVVELK